MGERRRVALRALHGRLVQWRFGSPHIDNTSVRAYGRTTPQWHWWLPSALRLLSLGSAHPKIFCRLHFQRCQTSRGCNRTIGDAADLVMAAERQLVFMAIPFILSVHHAYAVDCLELVMGGDRSVLTEPTSRDDLVRLEIVHTRLMDECGTRLPNDLLALFDLLRHIRNRIVHFAGVQGSHLAAKWRGLSLTARSGWEEVARGSLPLGGSSEELELGFGELIATWMVVTRLGREMNEAVARAVPRDRWAMIVVNDYRGEHPSRWAQVATRTRRCRGFARRTTLHLALVTRKLRPQCASSMRRSPDRSPGFLNLFFF